MTNDEFLSGYGMTFDDAEKRIKEHSQAADERWNLTLEGIQITMNSRTIKQQINAQAVFYQHKLIGQRFLSHE